MPLDIIKDESGEEVTFSPHLAITHMEAQGGSANKRNVSLLMKSEELDDKTKQLLKAILGEDIVIEKMTASNKREMLSEAVREQYNSYDRWAYVEDFSDEEVVVSTDDGLVVVSYSMSGNVVTLGENPVDVSRVLRYEDASGTLLLSNERGDINEGVYDLIVKSFDSISSHEKIKAIFKSKYENEVMNVEQEIQKALAPVQAELTKAQADLAAVTAERDTAVAALGEVKKAQEEAKQAARVEVIKSVVKDEAKVEELSKSLESLSDEHFDTVIKSFKAKDEVVENSDLFKQVGSQSSTENGSTESALDQILKAKYVKQA